MGWICIDFIQSVIMLFVETVSLQRCCWSRNENTVSLVLFVTITISTICIPFTFIYGKYFIFQVNTKLEHPTKYHVTENRKRQIEMFICESQHDRSTHSLPTMLKNNAAEPPYSGSAPADPDSPLSAEANNTSLSDVSEMLVPGICFRKFCAIKF